MFERRAYRAAEERRSTGTTAMIRAGWTIFFEDASHAVRGVYLFNLLSCAHYPVGKVNEATCHLRSSILILMLKTSYRDCSALIDNKMPKPDKHKILYTPRVTLTASS
ncbi:hypothetical protein AVEN_17296-1 [Araneus ventricosus]|uniref:Uncharacterized protein n=1 Tax=Araneus ventricosus TaxID=182803 RepID=A0A4Y2PS87_ARAVE|nr:hypothetical protein AVEN_17296-1 [Araneus ventricosus]